MRTETVRVHSCADGHVLRHVTEREARVMCAEDSFGDRLEEIEPIARRLSRKKQRLQDIVLLIPARAERTSPCTITRSETENNAFVHEGVRLGPLDSIRALDSATAKVEAWPEIHDDRNIVISAGKAFGVIVADVPESYLNFA
jgi:hypothetical protein